MTRIDHLSIETTPAGGLVIADDNLGGEVLVTPAQRQAVAAAIMADVGNPHIPAGYADALQAMDPAWKAILDAEIADIDDGDTTALEDLAPDDDLVDVADAAADPDLNVYSTRGIPDPPVIIDAATGQPVDLEQVAARVRDAGRHDDATTVLIAAMEQAAQHLLQTAGRFRSTAGA
jgi:hypothetical protein